MHFLILGRSVGLKKKNPNCVVTFFFLKMPKIWVGQTTLNGEKKEDGLNSNKIVPILWAVVRSFLFFIAAKYCNAFKAHVKNLLLSFTK